MVYRRCLLLLRDEERAMDAMHEVFIRMLLKRDKLNHDKPSSLLFHISTNVCLNLLRRHDISRLFKNEPSLCEEVLAEDNEKRFIIRDTLERIFGKEKISTRAMAVMHFVDGMTLNEVAREVGLSRSGVRRRLRKLRERIKKKECGDGG